MIEILRYWPKHKPVPEGWAVVHDFAGAHWSQFCHHGVYAVLIKKVAA